MYICVFMVVKFKFLLVIIKLEGKIIDRIVYVFDICSICIYFFLVFYYKMGLYFLVFGYFYGVESICFEFGEQDRFIQFVLYYLEYIIEGFVLVGVCFVDVYVFIFFGNDVDKEYIIIINGYWVGGVDGFYGFGCFVY